MGPLSSQTKCNTFLERCCHGAQVQAALIGRPMRDCPTSSRWPLDQANRGSSGSPAIDDLSRDEAQSRPSRRLQTELRPGTDARAALVGLSPGTGARPASRRPRASRQRLVPRTGRWPSGPPGRPQRDQPREHLPLHLCPNGSHQGLSLAPLFAARQEQTRLPRQEGRKLRDLHRRPRFRIGTAAGRRRSATPGHWEADLMLFAKYGQAVLTVHERQCRILLATRPPNKAAEPIAKHLLTIFKALPPNLRRTVTFDNGTEFARHRALHRLDLQTFFCDPYAPWQKGGIENAIGRMRRFIPRKTDLATLSDQRFHALLNAYNNTPRKCLDFATPAEMFQKLLHFECESTSPRARG